MMRMLASSRAGLRAQRLAMDRARPDADRVRAATRPSRDQQVLIPHRAGASSR